MENPLVRLAQSIGYPDAIDLKAVSHMFIVDGHEIDVSVDGDRLLMKSVLDVPEGELIRFAGFAAGRVLKEEATLSYDPTDGRVFLWQAVKNDAGSGVMRAAFERFANSCDWWGARTEEIGKAEPEFPEVMIRP